MKFVCLNPECKKTFVYPAKLLHDASSPPWGVVEKHVCSYCLSLNIDEQPEVEFKICSVISVPIEDVDAKLKEGYVVKELYAKSATLVKLDKTEA
jgi:hypothetical protein